MYAQLGDIIFEGLKGISGLTDKKEAVYAEHALIDAKPRLQRTGNALDEFTIAVKFHVAFCDPEAEYDALNRYRDDGEILPLIYGTGYVEGTFVITTLNRTVNATSKTGEYIDIDVTIGLKEFYQPDAGNQKRALLNAFAVSADRPTPTNVPVPLPTADALALALLKAIMDAKRDILNKINAVKDAINAANSLIDKAQAFAEKAADTAAKLSSGSATMGSGLTSGLGLMSDVPGLGSVAPALNSSLNTVLATKANFDSAVSSFTSLPVVADPLTAQYALDAFDAAATQSTLIDTAMHAVDQASSPLKAFKSLRKAL